MSLALSLRFDWYIRNTCECVFIGVGAFMHLHIFVFEAYYPFLVQGYYPMVYCRLHIYAFLVVYTSMGKIPQDSLRAYDMREVRYHTVVYYLTHKRQWYIPSAGRHIYCVVLSLFSLAVYSVLFHNRCYRERYQIYFIIYISYSISYIYRIYLLSRRPKGISIDNL